MMQILVEENTEIFIIEVVDLAEQGVPGESAYEYAIRTGAFVGNQEQWYNSLTAPAQLAVQTVTDVNIAKNATIQATQNALTATSQLEAIVNEAGTAIENANDATQNTVIATAQTVQAKQATISATELTIQATIQVNNARDNATTATIQANNAADLANDVAVATDVAKAASIAATQLSSEATVATNNARDNAVTATANANTATTAANTARDAAIIAATNASSVSAVTETVRLATITARDNAVTATANANTATTAANTARDSANVAATNASSISTVTENVRLATITARDNAVTATANANTATTQANTARDAANVAADNINNSIQLNNRAAGNILRANGTVFESVPEVEFLRNINSYNRAPDSKFFDNKQLVAWDNFNRVNTNPVVITDSGHPYSLWRGTTRGEVLNSAYTGSGLLVESSSIFTIPNTKNIGIEFSMMRSTLSGQITGIAIVKDDNNYIVFGRFFKNAGIGAGNVFSEIPLNVDYSLFVVINGISTTIGSISQQTMYSGGGNLDSFLGSRLNFIIKYGNRGRNGNSSVVVQSLDNPTLRIDVNITQFNSTFVTPADYNRIALISNYGDAGKIHSFKIANLDL
jgi:hypothetical protein